MAKVNAREADLITICDARAHPMAHNEVDQLGGCIERFVVDHSLARRAAIRIDGNMRTHVGMGSATAIRLGTIEALALLNQAEIPTDRLVAASGRGGTSGIGVNTYFTCGLFCDLGRPNDGNVYMPSSQVRPTRPPLALSPVSMPLWPMLLCVPRAIAPKSQEEEIAFFQRTTPLPPHASFEATYIALFELYAAAIEKDYLAFCRGVTRMQQTIWKRAERDEYGELLRDLSERLVEAGADCVGMSSLGPMLFCFGEAARLRAIGDRAHALGCDVYSTTPANAGRIVTRPDA
jgi:beta-ribofuranosylaminobenzene 5'-phosphate synthase